MAGTQSSGINITSSSGGSSSAGGGSRGGRASISSETVAKFAKRTGRRIIQDRKGAQVIAEKTARTTPKTSDKVAKAAAREAAGPKAKGPGGRAQTTRSNKPLNLATKLEKNIVVKRTGNKPGEFENVEKFGKKKGAIVERTSTSTEKAARDKIVTVKKMTAVKKTAAKNASDPQGYKKAKEGFEAAKTPIKRYAAKKPQRLTRIEQKRIDRINARIEKDRPTFKRVRQSQKEKAAQREVDYKDPTKVIQEDSSGRVIGSTTKGALRQLKVDVEGAAKDTRNTLRGKPQRTIDERTSRPKELTPREIKILRTVGKRDYNDPLAIRQGRTANILADKINQGEADRRVAEGLKDPVVRARIKAEEKAALNKFRSDNALANRAKKIIKKNAKTFRGKAK